MEESEILFDQQAEEQAKRLLAYYSCLRKQQKMSQSELERITGLSRTAINRCENGKLMPTIRSMNKLLAPLGYQLSIVPLVEADGSDQNEEMEEQQDEKNADVEFDWISWMYMVGRMPGKARRCADNYCRACRSVRSTGDGSHK